MEALDLGDEAIRSGGIKALPVAKWEQVLKLQSGVFKPPVLPAFCFHGVRPPTCRCAMPRKLARMQLTIR